MSNVYNSKTYGKVVINVPYNPYSDVSYHMNTEITMDSLSSEQCGKLFDKICTSPVSSDYACGVVKSLKVAINHDVYNSGPYVNVASDAYISREFAASLRDYSEKAAANPGSSYGNSEVARLTLLKNLGDADCLVYRASTGEAATLDASGELNFSEFETATLGVAAEANIEL